MMCRPSSNKLLLRPWSTCSAVLSMSAGTSSAEHSKKFEHTVRCLMKPTVTPAGKALTREADEAAAAAAAEEERIKSGGMAGAFKSKMR